ncbi:serine/threonine-protein kinase [Herbidospora cretacea]|uniref:serine/threonine-protein kinase n=1 Tax=Herbidospora cretacea TaxID=28444 RepID=UPI00068B20BC|nr:serine/threonine-protein kinase [Herbidospora cretacea]
MSTWTVPGYREVRELGAGGGGRVVLATYETTGAYVAIKYLSETLRRDPGFLASFQREARLMVELENPNVVRLYEYVQSPQGDAAIVMELVDGVSLRSILAEHGNTSPEAALVVLKGSLLGLSAAHAHGVVHRDYKPENVLVQADGTSKLADFGIASHVGEAGQATGTPSYMAPEQWAGNPASPATDVYAATCVFFECLTGHRPYHSLDVGTLRRQHQGAPIPTMEVPGSVRALVGRGMAKDPMARPPTADQFVADLELAALAAYGRDWEERGRRHLAELATLMALMFPLAKPSSPAPQVNTSLARTILSQRLTRFAPRFAIAGSLVAAVVIAIVVAANGQTPVAGGTTLRPPTQTPAQEPAEEPPPVVPVEETTPPATPEEQPSTEEPSEEATTEQPSTVQPPGAVTPTVTATATATATPAAPPPLKVSGLNIQSFDGQSATVRIVTNTPAQVTMTVRFAQGTDENALDTLPPQVVPLAGATAYAPVVQQAFTAPACGTTSYRRITVETSPSAGKTASKTVSVKGGPCPPPAVENVTITGWDGKAAGVRLKADGTGRVKVLARFGRDGELTKSSSTTLSGHREYSFTARTDLGEPACGQTSTYVVQITTEPAAGNGTQTSRKQVTGPDCAPPAVSLQGWDGSLATVKVTSGSTTPITLTVTFTRTVRVGERQTSPIVTSTTAEVSGAKDYTRTFQTGYKQAPCGARDIRQVSVTAAPGGDTATREVTLDSPACPVEEEPETPTPSDSGPGRIT